MVPNETDRPQLGRPKTFDRDSVVGVAMDHYWRLGVENVSLNEICRLAGVSKPGLYREFGGEDGLMDAVLEHYAETVLTPTAEIIMQDRPFREVLRTLVDMVTDTHRSSPPGCLLVKLHMSPSSLGSATKARVEMLRRSARAMYADWVERAKQRGDIASGIPTRVAAFFLETQSTLLLIQMSLGEDPELLREQAWLAFAGLSGHFDDFGG